MNVVLDASAGIVLASGTTHEAARKRVAEASWVGVPSLYDFEVTNAIWKYVKMGGWTDEQAHAALERVLRLPEERVEGTHLAIEALGLAKRLGHPAYDAFYVALARRMDALLVTMDEKLIKIARRAGVNVDPKLARG